MKLAALKGNYDAIYSLGNLCLAAIQLEKNGIRPFAGPLDWNYSPVLSDVTRLLANRFAGFMDYPNLETVGNASDKLYLVLDKTYNILSNHDFFTHNNFPPHLAAYPEIKAKYDRRIARFLEKAQTSSRILFIRTEGTFEQVQELERVLSGLVARDYSLLVINHAPVSGIVELDWPLERVCALQFPDADIWEGNHELWSALFSGIALTDPA